ncbi:MAG: hypothetical protein ABI658_26970 [Acidimicrobiales bacterium]
MRSTRALVYPDGFGHRCGCAQWHLVERRHGLANERDWFHLLAGEFVHSGVVARDLEQIEDEPLEILNLTL